MNSGPHTNGLQFFVTVDFFMENIDFGNVVSGKMSKRLKNLVQNLANHPEKNNRFWKTCSPPKIIIEKSRVGRFLWNRSRDLGWIWADFIG